MHLPVTLQSFVEIGQTIAKIWQFNDFLNDSRPPFRIWKVWLGLVLHVVFSALTLLVHWHPVKNLCIVATSVLFWINAHNRFMALFPGLPEWAGAKRNLLLDFVVQGKITEADTPTIQTNWRPTSITPPPRHFYAGCPFCRNLPILSWLGTGTKCAGLHTQWLGFYSGINEGRKPL